nr:hypothetical protein [Tanacetum cinerariifolium]
LIPYLRFTKIITYHYMIKHPYISRRIHDNYHRVKNDDLVTIFNSSKNKEGEGMTPNAPRPPNPITIEGESSAQCKSTVVIFRVPRRQDIDTPILTGAEIDVTNFAETIQMSIATQRSIEDFEAQQNVKKLKSTWWMKRLRILWKGQIIPYAKKSVDDVTVTNDEVEEESIGDEFELKKRDKGKGIEESKDTHPPTPIRSPRSHISLLSTDKETLQEWTVIVQDAPSSLDKEKLKELTVTDPTPSSSPPKPETVDVAAMIAETTYKECENLRADISLQVTNALANNIPAQFQMNLIMKDDEKLRNDDLSICWSLKIKFDKLTPSAAPCRTDFVHTRDHENHLDDDARPEGESSAKRQKMPECGTYSVRESSSEQAMDQEPNPSGSGEEHKYHADQMQNYLKSDIFWKARRKGPKKYTLSLHKFLAVPFPDDDIKERISRWDFGNVEKYNKDVKYGYANPCPSNADAEYLQLYEEDIEERLKHRD